MLHLERNGVPVSTPIAQQDGNYINMLQAPEGLRQVVLFTCAQGKALKRHIAEIDLTSIPTFVALREIWYMALIAAMQFNAGIQNFDKFMQRTISLLQEWEKSQLKL